MTVEINFMINLHELTTPGSAIGLTTDCATGRIALQNLLIASGFSKK